jgi:hypothetical protein
LAKATEMKICKTMFIYYLIFPKYILSRVFFYFKEKQPRPLHDFEYPTQNQLLLSNTKSTSFYEKKKIKIEILNISFIFSFLAILGLQTLIFLSS